MSDKPTKKPQSGKSKLSLPGPVKDPTKIKETAPGIRTIAWPAKPKVSIENDNARAEAKFGKRGAKRPWKSRGIGAKSKGSTDVKPKAVRRKMRSADMGISQKTGYKKIG